MRRSIALVFSALMSGLGAVHAAPSEPTPLPAPEEAPRVEPQRIDPALARANADMFAVYRATATQVSGEAQIALFESQRHWTRYAGTLCQIAEDQTARIAHGRRRETQSQCLTRAAVERELELKGALQTVGPWTFLRLTDRRVHLARAGRDDEMVEEALTRVQIARPATESERRWNLVVGRQLEQTLAGAYDPAAAELSSTSESRDIGFTAVAEVAATNADLIDVSIHAKADPVGAAPPRSSSRSLIWSMRLGRAVEATDLFDPRSPWRPSLAQIVADRIEPAAPDGATGATVQAVMSLAADPTRWTLRTSGLVVDLRSSALGSGQVLAPWPLLEPYLKRPLFVNPASLTEAPRG